MKFPRALLAFLLLLIIVSACQKQDAEPIDEAAQLERRKAFRERLKVELGDTYDKTVPPATKAQLVRGKILYVQICSSCHGTNGKGTGETAKTLEIKPADLTDAEQATFFSEQARLYIIRKGINSTPMIGWENVLSEEDVLAVFGYVRSLAFPQNIGERKDETPETGN